MTIGAFLRLPEVERETGMGKSTIWAKVKQKKFPQPVRFGGKCTRWVASEIEAWKAALIEARDGPAPKPGRGRRGARMSKTSKPHNGGPVNPANSAVQAAEGLQPLLDEASADATQNPSSPEEAAIGRAAASSSSGDPIPPVTGTELEAEDRALLRAENARLKRLGEALYREHERHGDWGEYAVGHNFPWVQRAFINGACGSPLFRDDGYLKLYWQVQDELAELKRKQGQDKAD
jgi:prophage regulatory protein